MSREEENMDGNVVSTNAQVSNGDSVETTAAEDEAAVGDGKWSFSSSSSQEKCFSKLTT